VKASGKLIGIDGRFEGIKQWLVFSFSFFFFFFRFFKETQDTPHIFVSMFLPHMTAQH
jgi:hypothetical protein